MVASNTSMSPFEVLMRDFSKRLSAAVRQVQADYPQYKKAKLFQVARERVERDMVHEGPGGIKSGTFKRVWKTYQHLCAYDVPIPVAAKNTGHLLHAAMVRATEKRQQKDPQDKSKPSGAEIVACLEEVRKEHEENEQRGWDKRLAAQRKERLVDVVEMYGISHDTEKSIRNIVDSFLEVFRSPPVQFHLKRNPPGADVLLSVRDQLEALEKTLKS